MKFTAVLAFIAAATFVSAASTNADRFARGLPPNPPAKRATRRSEHEHEHEHEHKHKPHKPHPSHTPHKCKTGSPYCCNTVGKAGASSTIDQLLQVYGIDIPVGTVVGTNCDPLTVVGAGSTSCKHQAVCCQNNHIKAAIAFNCVPMNVHL